MPAHDFRTVAFTKLSHQRLQHSLYDRSTASTLEVVCRHPHWLELPDLHRCVQRWTLCQHRGPIDSPPVRLHATQGRSAGLHLVLCIQNWVQFLALPSALTLEDTITLIPRVSL